MSQKKRRVFFALWPNQDIRDKLDNNIHSEVNSFLQVNKVRRVPKANWHLTLAFIGNVEEQTIECLIKQANEIKPNSFILELSQFGFFKKPQVVWLGCKTAQPGWYDLITQINNAGQPCGYEPDRKDPVPHMTVLRKAKRGLKAKSFAPVVWPVNEFALMESISTDKGVSYSIIKQWPLNQS